MRAHLFAALILLWAAPPAWAESPEPQAGAGEASSDPRRPTAEELRAQVDAQAEEGVLVIIDKEPDPSRIAGAAHRVDERKLETYEYDDVQRVLQAVPGVYLRVEDGFGLRPNIGLRGANSDRSSKVTLMEDGVLIAPAPYAAPAAYYFPLMTTMRALEVYKGPAAIRFGPQTVGGAINMLTTRIPTAPMGYLDVGVGTFGFRKLHARAGSGGPRWGALIEAVHLESTGFKHVDGGGETGFDKDEVRVKLRFQTDAARRVAQSLEARLAYSDEASHETYVGLTDEDFALDPYRRYAGTQRDLMTWTHTQAALTWRLAAGDSLTVNTTAYRHDFDRVWSKLNGFDGGIDLHTLLSGPVGGQAAVYLAILKGEEDSASPDQALLLGNNHRTYVSQGIQSVAHLALGGAAVGHQVETGLRLHYDHIDRDHTADTFWMSGGQLIATGDPTEQTTLNRGEAFAVAAYAQDEILFGRWIVTPGLRTELIWTAFYEGLADDGSIVADPEPAQRFDPVLLPGLGALYQARPWLALLAGVNRGFSAVSPGQAPETRPEWSINYEAGARLGGQALRGEVIGFFNDYQNLTADCTYSRGCEESQLDTQYAGGEVDVYGVEASAGAAGTVGPDVTLSGALTYTLTRSAFKNAFASPDPAFGDVEPGFELPYVPQHQGSLELGVARPRWRVDLTAAAVSAMRDAAGAGPIPEGTGTDPFWILDLAAAHDIGEAGSLYLKVDNVFNEVWIAGRRPQGARPGKPQQLIVGYKQRF